jgi:hypothetical protein
LFIVLQLAAVTEERNKLRNLANLKSGEAGDESSTNPIQVVFPSICHHLTYHVVAKCFLLVFWLIHSGT